jgi:ATP-dependent helicase/nuclease subunit B
MGGLKNVFTIAPNAPFLDTLAKELWRRANGDGFRLSQNLILLPTRRACRNLGTSFARLAHDHLNGQPILLPRMRPLGDIDEDEFSFADEGDFDLPPAMGSLKRLMLLTQQVQRRNPNMSIDQAAQAAEALARFLDQIEIEQCDVSKLPNLVADQELAEHWQQTVLFLEIVTQNWPLILAEHGCRDPAERRNAVLAAQADVWRRQPPSFPIIAAGSTGSIRATGELLDVIAGLPQGSVILPGLDRALDAAAWDVIDDTHPQHSMKLLLNKMAVQRENVHDWGEERATSPRVNLMSAAMRPAALTEAWRKERGKMSSESVAGLTRLTLDHPQEEAQVIALRLRALLEQPQQTAAFVTADRSLAMRVASLLRRWGIEVDDSGGSPLAMLPLGAFLNLVLAAADPHAGNVDLLALLKHPLTACGMIPAACRETTRAAEVRLRHNKDESFARVKQLLQPLTQHWHSPFPLAERIAAHVTAAEAIAATEHENGSARLWRGEIGDGTTEWLDEWRNSADGFPPLSGSDYTALFGSLSSSKTMRAVHTANPRLNILGPLEARLINADLIILGGMNEGAWPPDAGFDPWMSRPMRKNFGLPAPEFRIGLSAHDFAQLACAPQVMLTRSLRSGGTPTVPSRFLLQIDAVLRATGLSDTSDALEPIETWREWAHALDAPDVIQACDRPQPCPPVDVRPMRLSVTEISTWQRNPYAIYARHILGLERLEELDAELDASDRGTMIHAALEQFVTSYSTTMPVDAEAKLMEIGRGIFAPEQNDPRVQAFWWANFTSITRWFIAHERERRAVGTRPLNAEAKGDIVIDEFTLHGRADRVDRLANGELSIIDYKTGGVPSKNEVKSGIEPQLSLLALIASSGGFSGIAPATSGSLEYWVLKGGRSGCKADVLTGELADLVAHAEDGLRQLIAEYAKPTTSYKAVPKPRLQPRFNDYAHLSRLSEWGRTADDL